MLPVNNRAIFDGIRVLDFTRVLAGPYCTRLLADMGAEVIKVEQPVVGDASRDFPYIINEKDTGYYLQQNCGKKSISVDLHKEEAVDIIKKLVMISDVVVENFRPGVMHKYGLDYPNLNQWKRNIIMCSISAYGQTGPYSPYVGNDLTTQAISGFMDMTGQPNGPPNSAGTSIADTIAGAHAYGAIAAALFYREKTGKGEYIDIAMLDCMFTQFEIAVQSYILSDGEIKPSRFGDHHPTVVPLGVYQAKDGWLIVGVFNDDTWNRLANTMGRPELVNDARFMGNTERFKHKELVIKMIKEWIIEYPVSQVLEKLQEARILTAPVLSIEQVVNHPQIRARNMLVNVEHESIGTVKIINTPIKLTNTKAHVTGKAACIGEHNKEILDLLGYSENEITELYNNSVIYHKYK